MVGINISGWASYVPKQVLTNDELSKWVDTSDEWIAKRTGISKRHISSGENASDMAIQVAQQLLKKTGLLADNIDLIIVSTITPDFLCPSVACIVQDAIGATTAAAFDINAACTGYVYGFSTAHKFLQSGMYKNVMLIGAEILSKYTDYSDRATCILFGDAAAGMLLQSDNKKRLYAESLRAKGGLAITTFKQEVFNPFSDNGKGDMREMDYIKVEGREVFDFAVKNVSENISSLLADNELDVNDIDYIIPHQANRRIIEGIAKKLGADINKFYINIENYGNTSSASIPLAFCEMADTKKIKSGSKIVLSGFGGGLTWGSVLLEL